MGTPSLPAYDPKVIEQFADKLYRKASAFVAGSVVIGGRSARRSAPFR